MTQEGKSTEDKKEGLSLRDALDVAITVNKEEGKDVFGNKTDETPPASAVPPERSPQALPEAQEAPPGRLDPPAEYTAAEKKDFAELNRAGQEAQLRLDRSRHRKLEELKATSAETKRELAELGWTKELVKEVEPYLKSMGGKLSAREQVLLAVRMRNEFESGDPNKAAAQYLKAKGKPVPRELLASEDSDSGFQEKIAPLQKDINEIKSRQEREDHARITQTLSAEFGTFSNVKNAAGKPRYPDLDDPQLGPQIAGSIGSLAGGKDPLSAPFIARAKAADPSLTYQKLFEKAYVFSGGRIDDSAESPTRTQDPQHLIKSNRAAAIPVPGKSQSTKYSNPVKFGNFRDAAAHALAQIKERDGN